MPKIIFLVGLPASGKSIFMQDYHRQGIPAFDDFMKFSPRDFKKCRHLDSIRTHLVAGRDVVLSDVRLVDQCFRDEVLNGLKPIAFEAEWHCFANEPDQCLKNSAKRVTEQSLCHESEINLIKELSAAYTFPVGSRLIPVAFN